MKRILSSIVVAILLTLPVSAFCVSLGNYVELNNATEISNVTELRNVQDLGGLESETIAFIARVIADGGTVEDTNFLNSFIVDAKNNNYFSDIVAAYSPSWGVKGTTTASKLYSLIGATGDAEQTVGAEQPTITAADANGKTRLTFDGVNDSMFTGALAIAQPLTVILGGVQQVVWSLNDILIHGGVNGEPRVFQSAATPDIKFGTGSVVTNTDLSVGVDHHARFLYNGLSSAGQVDAVAETPGSAGNAALSKITIGAAPLGVGNWANVKYGMIIHLNAAVDGSYATKMTALYNFSKSAYGTP